MNVKPQASSHSSLVIQSNLALFKPAVRSSNYNQYTAASKAVDGDVTSRKLSGNAATRASDKNPYWRVDLQGTYLVQTVDFFSRLDCCLDMMETIEVRVGTSLENNGNSNPLCGEPVDMTHKKKHTFRCEVYGRYVNIKKTNTPAAHNLVILEVIVNKEPTSNIALGKPTQHSSRHSSGTGSERAVDGKTGTLFATKSGIVPQWWMVDFEATKPVVKIVVVPRQGQYLVRLSKIIITIGDSSVGRSNPRFGRVHDLSRSVWTALYLKPLMYGRYAYFESLMTSQMNLVELEFYSESRPYIAERSNGRGRHDRTFYSGRLAVLPCEAYGNPTPCVAWVVNGVVLQNRTTDTDLVLTVNLTKGSSQKYECYATNIHGKDYYDVTVTAAGQYDMCLRPLEMKDSTRDKSSKLNLNEAPKADINTFKEARVYKFYNPEGRKFMKLTTSCPPPRSCNTDAPGWMNGTHPKPEDGLVRRTVCFHYAQDCCYESVDIFAMNCPGMFVYKILNKPFPFAARYCFESDGKNEAFTPFKSSPKLFTIAGGTNTALANHVIAKDHDVDDSYQCLLVCLMNKCRSFNYAQSEKTCEVNDVTKSDSPLDLITKSGFQYYHPVEG